SKDIPFFSMFLICFYFIARAFENKSFLHFLVVGFLLGILINIRIMGVLLLAAVIFFLLLDLLVSKKYLHHVKLIMAVFITSVFALVLTWPYLWESPVSNFITAFKRMAHFRWDSSVMFMGEMLSSLKLPWSYSVVWFLITTPILYTALAFLGILILIKNVLKSPKNFLQNNKQRNNLIYLITFIAPVVTVVVLDSVLYDSWRQLYFIYSGAVMLAVYALYFMWEKAWRKTAVGLVLVAFLPIILFMFKNHPFQHVYFNALVDTQTEEYIRKNYEMDYWGTSFKQALEYILENDSSTIIKISLYPNDPGVRNLNILRESQKQRIQISPIEEADYFVTTYRWHPADYPEYQDNKFHKIKVGNNTIIEIFKLK